MGYDAAGRAFEDSLSPRERRKLGQHFTSDEIADILIAFCVRDPDDIVLDPSCGAGAFLLRAYHYKKSLNPRLSDDAILRTLYGVEIAELPAQLARHRAGCVVHGDFLQAEVRKALPAADAIIGNPPYTRQEYIDEKDEGLGRAGLHSYFLIAAFSLLKEAGFLGFVMPDAWLQTEYGRQLQHALLERCKILAIVSSKVERWFPDADVNTCLLVVERSSDAAERENNAVRFVQLKVPLERAGLSAEALRDDWLAHTSPYENAAFAINVVPQRSLVLDGTTAVTSWSTYLHAPSVHTRAVQIAAQKALPLLRDLAEVRFGVKSGANGFFYLSDEEIAARKLEPEYFQPLVFSLKEIRGYTTDALALPKRMLLCDKSKGELHGTHILAYIRHGEREGLHKRPTCANRTPWYALARGWKPAPLLFPSKIGERMPVARNDSGALEDKKFYGITPREPHDTPLIAALLNSTISRVFVEFGSRQLTGSQAIADVDVIVAERIPLPDPRTIGPELQAQILRAYEALAKTKCESLFKEFGSRMPENVTLSSIKPQLRRLDALVMGELWGLSDEDQLAVYRALVDHVAARLHKAASFTRWREARPKTPATA